MKKLFLSCITLYLSVICCAQVKVEHLLTENQVDPTSIDALTPRFSWMISAGEKRSVMQTGYEIKVSTYRYLKMISRRYGVPAR